MKPTNLAGYLIFLSQCVSESKEKQDFKAQL